MTRLKFWPYKMGSKGCKALARGCGALRVFTNRRYRPKNRHLIVNWGNSEHPNWWRSGLTMLNKPEAVKKASNKLSTLRSLSHAGVGIPCYTTDVQEAILWDDVVYCRTKLTSKGGDGIIIAGNEEEIVSAPLYTKKVDVDREFRVHVFDGQVLDFTEKKQMSRETLEERGIERNNHIRNHSNGWVFCRYSVELPDCVADTACAAVEALGLDFGAVDVCLDTNGNPCVFEVNTAPGVEGTTLQKYINILEEMAYASA